MQNYLKNFNKPYLCGLFGNNMKFKLLQKDKKSGARAGTIYTAHGTIHTPIFMPVGTAGAVKAIHMKDVKDDAKAQIILGNTYHLYLRPGLDILKSAGGLHHFNGWERPILTDSGGYQVYSLSQRRKLNAKGVTFQSHIDGSYHEFTPENVIDTQRIIGSDIMMVLDECTPYPCNYEYAKTSLDITHQWLDRCISRFKETGPLYGHSQALYPIVQGSTYKDLRKKSAEYISAKEADGNAIGGLAVGEPHDVMYEMTELVCNILPEDKPRYLMGVGTPVNILESIAAGVDQFDCVMPTRNGRNGMLFTSEGIINIKNKKWEKNFSLIDPNGLSFVDDNYTKAYLRHLFAAREILGAMIASLHNVRFYMWLVEEARNQIMEGTFAEWKDNMIPRLKNRL